MKGLEGTGETEGTGGTGEIEGMEETEGTGGTGETEGMEETGEMKEIEGTKGI